MDNEETTETTENMETTIVQMDSKKIIVTLFLKTKIYIIYQYIIIDHNIAIN